MSDSSGTNPTTDQTEKHSEDERWRRLFPYEEPYDNQAEAINRTQEVLRDGGYAITEAACGTGKTLVGLLAALELKRDPREPYDSVLCLTGVHQQLRAFEDDLRAINGGVRADASDDAPEQVSALTLVGKPDVCSYTATGNIDHGDIYSRCEDLRTPVRNAMAGLSKAEQETELRKLVANAEVDSNNEYDEPMGTDQWMSPHSEGFPETPETDYCGFYARSRLDTLFTDDGYEPNGVLAPDELRQQASSVGLCPHAVMNDSINNAEVIVANYRHIFDPRTVQAMTGSLLNERTLVVCDEAHSLVGSVQDELGDEITYFTLDRAISEVEYEVLNQSRRGVRDIIWQTLDSHDVVESDVKAFLGFLKRIRERLIHSSHKALEEAEVAEEFQNGERTKLPDEPTKPLRDPESPGETDWLTNWIVENGDQGLLENAREIGTAIGTAVATANENHSDYTRLETYSDSISNSLGRWESCGHVRYFREVVLEKREDTYEGADHDIVRHYNPRFKMHNCIPADEIADRFDRFGGGLFMSATLAPLDAFRETTGLSQLKRRGRPMEEFTYGLPFPRENRESLVVDLEPYTKTNRGPQGDFGNLRQKYAGAAATTVRETEGNVLIGMPNYDEAEWLASVLRNADTIEKEVLLDQSSSSAVTDALKEDFFAGPPKVAITSMRGTITEGVDYSGDRLDACVVCGVPLATIGGPLPEATKAAYGAVFGDDVDFEYAFVVPAIRKARQTWGRVIRGWDERGVRVVVDGRYREGRWNSARKYLPDYEDREFETVTEGQLAPRLREFWG